VKSTVEDTLNNAGAIADTDIFAVSEEARITAHEHNISTAKYLAIEELQQLDPTVEIEFCKQHTVSKIKELIHEHSCDLEDGETQTEREHEDEHHEDEDGHHT
jgi:hypothetical protein